MGLDIETRESIINLFKKAPHNIGSHSLVLNVRYGHVEFDDSRNNVDDDHNEQLENKINDLQGYLNEIANLANAALNDETIEKDDLLDIITEILVLAE